MDYMDEELAAILGADFPLSPAGIIDSSSSSAVINIPSFRSLTTVSDPHQLHRESQARHQKLENVSKLLSMKRVAPNIDKFASAPVLLNFENANSSPEYAQQMPVNIAHDHEEALERATKTRRVRPPSQTYDHIMAERKRREQLSQHFIALSAIVPGLKKMDKTSVLGETIKYLEHLQEKVKTLEQQAAATRQTMESVVLVKKSQLNVCSSNEKSTSSSDGHPLPEIEARVCNKSIRVKILCEKRKNVLVKILGEVEKMNLSVVNTSVASFGNSTLDITIIAEMEKDSSLAVKDIVKILFALLS